MIFEKKVLNFFFRKFTLYVAPITNQIIKRFGQKSYEMWRTTQKHFCKKNNIHNDTAVIANVHFIHYSFPQPIDAFCGIWKISASRVRLKMLTDGRAPDDSYLLYKFT